MMTVAAGACSSSEGDDGNTSSSSSSSSGGGSSGSSGGGGSSTSSSSSSSGEPLTQYEKEGGTISAPETWAAGDYLIKGSLTLRAVLTVDACAVLRMAPGTAITVATGGALKLMGRADCKIRVTSANAAGSPADWRYIEFNADSQAAANEIHHAIIEYAGDEYGALYVAGGTSVAVDNTTFQHNKTYGIQLVTGAHLRDFNGNVVTDTTGQAPVSIHVNSLGDLLGGTFTGNVNDLIRVEGGTVDKSATWKNLGVPYRVASFSVRGPSAPTRLVIEAGATIQVGRGQHITVGTNAGLHAAGTAAAKVTFTSSETSPSAADWGYLEFNADANDTDNVLEHTVVEYSGDEYGAVYLADDVSVKISNSTIRHSGHVGLQVVGSKSGLREFTGNTLTSNALGAVLTHANVAGQLGAGSYTGNADDVVRISGGTVSASATWQNLGVPFRFDAPITVQGPSAIATLSVAAGTTLQVGPNQVPISVNDKGVLKLLGTSASHVTVTSSAPAPTPGAWNEIDLYSLGNELTYTDIAYGGGGSYGQLWLGGSAGVTLNNAVFRNTETCDVKLSSGAQVNASGSTYTTCP